MLTSFWSTVGKGLAGEWNARLLTPGLAFWGGGLLAYNWRYGWQPFTQWIQTVDPVQGVAWLAGILFLLAISGGLVQWLTLPALRLAEGYWPRWLDGLRLARIRAINAGLLEKGNQLGDLAAVILANRANPVQAERYALLEQELGRYPEDGNLRLPTRLGNLLRAAEEYPGRVYGLDITTTWPALWLGLPKKTRRDLTRARQALDGVAQLLIWSTAFLIWIVWAWWALIPAALVFLAAWLRLVAVAEEYADLVRAVYDLHRFDLFENLHWPLPGEPRLEKQFGEALTLYLKRAVPPEALPPDGRRLFFSHRR